MQSAEHIATVVDYDKVFGSRHYKGYEVMRGETTQFVGVLKLRVLHHLRQRLLMNSRPLKTKASMLFLLNILVIRRKTLRNLSL